MIVVTKEPGMAKVKTKAKAKAKEIVPVISNGKGKGGIERKKAEGIQATSKVTNEKIVIVINSSDLNK